MKVLWKTGARVKAKPEAAHKVLEQIRAKNDGDLRLEDVVAASRPKTAPLHRDFEWDDGVAAQQYRLDQARYIVRSIEVIEDEAPAIQARAYQVSYTPAQTEEATKARPVYRSTKEMLADPIARDALLAGAIRDAIAYRRRYRMLSELSQVFRALDEFLTSGEAA